MKSITRQKLSGINSLQIIFMNLHTLKRALVFKKTQKSHPDFKQKEACYDC